MMPENGSVRKAALSVWTICYYQFAVITRFSTPGQPYELAVYDVHAMCG